MLLTETECGVQYHPGHARRILRQMGWGCQRPTGRARERDEAAIQCWKQKRWPEIKKSPSRAAHDRLRRRKRTEPETAPLSHMGAKGADARVAMFISTGRRVGDGGRDLVEFLLSAVSRHDSEPPGDRAPARRRSASLANVFRASHSLTFQHARNSCAPIPPGGLGVAKSPQCVYSRQTGRG